MTADEYLRNILYREAVDTSPTSPVLSVQGILAPHIRQWAGSNLAGIFPSGSFAKGTANRSGTDIDLFISLYSSTTMSLRDIYNSLFSYMQGVGYSPRKQNVSIGIRVNNYDVDLVPGKRQDNVSSDHSIYRHRADTWTKTNIQKHIQVVRNANRISETRILKLWRNQHSLDFPSFYLELATIEALYGRQHGLSGNVWQAFHYLRDTFPNSRFVDPANTNNIISDDLSATGKAAISSAARKAIDAYNWTEIVR